MSQPIRLSRRRLLACSPVVLGAAALGGAGLSGTAVALSLEPMSVPVQKDYLSRCTSGIDHARLAEELEKAFGPEVTAEQKTAVLREIEAAARCPLCGCPVSLSPEEPATPGTLPAPAKG